MFLPDELRPQRTTADGSPHRGGFSLVELLVVLGVIAIVAGLLLPAAQRARESARSLECKNRLAQLGRASQAHQAATGLFPWPLRGRPRGSISEILPTDQALSFSAHVWLLPYLEPNLWDAYNMVAPNIRPGGVYGEDHPHPENWTVADTVVKAFLCPSDPMSPGTGWSAVNFRANFGRTYARPYGNGTNATVIDDRRAGGAFRWRGPLRPEEFPDGLAHTVFFAEKAVGPGLRDAGFDRFVGWWDATKVDWVVLSADDHAALCGSLVGEPARYQNLVGKIWALPGISFTHYTHDLVPNAAIPDCATGPNEIWGAIAARSYHSALVNVVFGDGSARSVDQSIDLAVWRGLGTRDGGETVAGDR
jgi:prepilin-type N-terminal cleavage/methylation domain-containing protein